MTSLRIVILLDIFCLSMIFSGKPVPTPHQVHGRHFPDHALDTGSHARKQGKFPAK